MDTFFLVYPDDSARFLRRSIAYGLLAGSALCLPTSWILLQSYYPSTSISSNGMDGDTSDGITEEEPYRGYTAAGIAGGGSSGSSNSIGASCGPSLQAFLSFRLILWILQVPLRIWFFVQLGRALQATTRRTLVESLLRLTSSYGWRFNQYIGIPANLAFALIAILAWKRPDCGDPSIKNAPYQLYRMTIAHLLSFGLHLFGCFMWFRSMHQREELAIQMAAAHAAGDGAAPVRVGFNDALISQYTTCITYSSTSHSNYTNCSICISSYEDGQAVRILPCSHDYHAKCVDVWLQVKARCPLCSHGLTDPPKAAAIAATAAAMAVAASSSSSSSSSSSDTNNVATVDDGAATAIVATMISRILNNVIQSSSSSCAVASDTVMPSEHLNGNHSNGSSSNDTPTA